MTAQIGDLIKIDGEWHSLAELPLEPLLDAMPSRPPFTPTTTANWRRYVARWEILDNQLFLVGLKAELDATSGLPPVATGSVDIHDLMRSQHRPIFADWYSGTLRVPKGKELQYVHGGFETIYEFDLFIEVQNGEIKRRWEVDNRPAHAERQAVKDLQKRSLVGLIYKLGEGELRQAYASLANPLTAATERVPSEEALRNVILSAKLGLDRTLMRQTFLRTAIYDLIRVYFESQVTDRTPLSSSDCAARENFDTAIKRIERALMAHIYARSFRKHLQDSEMRPTDSRRMVDRYIDELKQAEELELTLNLPESHEERLEWAVATMRDIESCIKNGNFELLGVALETIEDSASGEQVHN